MSERTRVRRALLWALLAAAVLLLGAVLAVLLPILTHQSAGGSGQEIPEGFASETSAVGADGRTRTLAVERADGDDLSDLTPGETIVVRGSGFDASIGIYVAICAIPESPAVRPSPCLGGIPEGAEEGDVSDEALPSAWITDSWTWRPFATARWDDAETGAFAVKLTVAEAASEELDCRVTRCAVATRSDHTAGSDRVQDMLLPVAFAE